MPWMSKSRACASFSATARNVLSSNEFGLVSSGERHPLELAAANCVPAVRPDSLTMACVWSYADSTRRDERREVVVQMIGE
jgi:hypothetical protein